MNTIAAIGVALEEALADDYQTYCQRVVANAQLLAKELMTAGLAVLTGGTDNHLLLIDLRPLNLSGQDAQNKLEQAGINVNMNAIPYDSAPPRNPSGLRLGTPAVTTRGITETKLKELAEKIATVLKP
jgi:glycine hydroxymethyltransferase